MLPTDTRNRKTFDFQNGYMAIAAEAFLTDRQASDRAAGTLEYYRQHLNNFIAWCNALSVKHIHELSADLLRRYLLARAEGHTSGGVHASYRAVRAFLLWVEAECHKQHARRIEAAGQSGRYLKRTG